jgi:hypothetical protein
MLLATHSGYVAHAIADSITHLMTGLAAHDKQIINPITLLSPL